MHVLTSKGLHCTCLEVRDLEGAALLKQLLALGAAPCGGPVHMWDLSTSRLQDLGCEAGIRCCTGPSAAATSGGGSCSSTSSSSSRLDCSQDSSSAPTGWLTSSSDSASRAILQNGDISYLHGNGTQSVLHTRRTHWHGRQQMQPVLAAQGLASPVINQWLLWQLAVALVPAALERPAGSWSL